MKKRIAYISLYFFTVLLIFILQKPLFMLYNGSIEKGFGLADYMQVMVHGASLDAATAGYLTALPFLLVLVSIWLKKFPLKKILWGYYILVATLVSIIFVVDMALYTFWGFKLDASVFLYVDSPKEALASVSTGFIALRVLIITDSPLCLLAFENYAFCPGGCPETMGGNGCYAVDRRCAFHHDTWWCHGIYVQYRASVFQ